MKKNKKLSIIIPVFNEEKTVADAIEKVLLQKIGGWQKEIIVVNDGSTDNTQKELDNFSARASDILRRSRSGYYKISIVRHDRNLGKGAALRSGFKAFSGDAIIIQDADLEYSPADWPAMLEKLEQNNDVAAIFGSRELSGARKGYFLCVLGVKLLTFLVNLIFGSKLTDIYTCYKLMRADFIKKTKLESNGFEIEAEITCKLLKGGGVIKEVPINYFPRTYRQGKKIGIKDELLGIKTILKCWMSA